MRRTRLDRYRCPFANLSGQTRMDPFSYVCILTSIVAGLAMTRLVGGIGQLTPDTKTHADLLGAFALDGERIHDRDHCLVGPVSLA